MRSAVRGGRSFGLRCHGASRKAVPGTIPPTNPGRRRTAPGEPLRPFSFGASAIGPEVASARRPFARRMRRPNRGFGRWSTPGEQRHAGAVAGRFLGSGGSNLKLKKGFVGVDMAALVRIDSESTTQFSYEGVAKSANQAVVAGIRNSEFGIRNSEIGIRNSEFKNPWGYPDRPLDAKGMWVVAGWNAFSGSSDGSNSRRRCGRSWGWNAFRGSSNGSIHAKGVWSAVEWNESGHLPVPLRASARQDVGAERVAVRFGQRPNGAIWAQIQI